jgi:hypothetical protein
MSAQERSVLRNVISVARRELADRDTDDVPARLRRVAKNSSRKLPPPFADSVLRELRESDDFRTAVRDRWEEEGIDDPVGLAFLDDPDEAIDEVVASSKDVQLERSERELAEAHTRNESLERQLSEAKRRVASLRYEHEQALGRRQEVEDASKAGMARAIGELEVDLREARLVSERLSERVHELETALEAAAERFARSVEREARRRAPVSTTRDLRAVEPPKDPEAFAEWLDTVERVQRPYREVDLVAEPAESPDPIVIPNGVQPDTAEAVAAVVAQRPDVVIIDGYNVAGSLSQEAFSTRSARTSVVAKAERLGASSGADVVVVFDASQAEGRASFRSTGGVDVVFSQGCSADDEIVAMTRRFGERTVVVTNDRELRERCSPYGVVSLWSDALVEWANR